MILRLSYKRGQGDKAIISQILDELTKTDFKSITILEPCGGLVKPNDMDSYTSFFKEENKTQKEILINGNRQINQTFKNINFIDLKDLNMKLPTNHIKADFDDVCIRYFTNILNEDGINYLLHGSVGFPLCENYLIHAYKNLKPDTMLKKHLIIIDCADYLV